MAAAMLVMLVAFQIPTRYHSDLVFRAHIE